MTHLPLDTNRIPQHPLFLVVIEEDLQQIVANAAHFVIPGGAFGLRSGCHLLNPCSVLLELLLQLKPAYLSFRNVFDLLVFDPVAGFAVPRLICASAFGFLFAPILTEMKVQMLVVFHRFSFGKANATVAALHAGV